MYGKRSCNTLVDMVTSKLSTEHLHNFPNNVILYVEQRPDAHCAKYRRPTRLRITSWCYAVSEKNISVECHVIPGCVSDAYLRTPEFTVSWSPAIIQSPASVMSDCMTSWVVLRHSVYGHLGWFLERRVFRSNRNQMSADVNTQN